MKLKEVKATVVTIVILILLFIVWSRINERLEHPTYTTTIPPTITTTTIIDCGTIDPNYCDTNDDCICSMSKCFRGNKEYFEYCVEEAEVCPMNFCLFAPGEGMICVNNKCQIG